MYKLPVCRDEIITGCVFEGCWGISVALSVFNKHQGQKIWDAGGKAHKHALFTNDPARG